MEPIKPLLRTVRAVGAEFVRRTIKPYIIGGAIAAVVLLVLGGWLISRSAWWWILEVVWIASSLLFVILSVTVWQLTRLVDASSTKQQRVAVSAYVDKLGRVAEHISTPQFMILFYIVRDIIKPRKQSFIAEVSHDSQSLAPDFVALQKLFKNS